MRFAEAGYTVTGVEIDRYKLKKLSRAMPHTSSLAAEELRRNLESGRFSVSEVIPPKGFDVALICAPTPLMRDNTPDLRELLGALNSVGSRLTGGELVIVESTIYPGAMHSVVMPTLMGYEKDSWRIGRDLFVAFSPERVNPGDKSWGLHNTPKVVSGATPGCLEVASALYKTIVARVVEVNDIRVAEMTKLVENAFRAVNIAFINEVAKFCADANIDVWEVIDAASTKPFGFMPFRPGPGVGGHCIPVDPQYLVWCAKQAHVDLTLLQSALDVNSYMPTVIADRIKEIMNSWKGWPVIMVGVTFKKNVDDVRNSPALEIVRILLERGLPVQYYDPLVPKLSLWTSRGEWRKFSIQTLDGRARGVYILGVDHDCLPYEDLLRFEGPIIDLTGKLRTIDVKSTANIMDIFNLLPEKGILEIAVSSRVSRLPKPYSSV